MEIQKKITVGICREEKFVVEDIHTAYHIGSGDEKVLGTPWMISFIERVANRLIAEYLPEGYMSVGTHLDVFHLAPTPVNVHVQIRVEVLEISHNRILFGVEAWDPIEKIGEGRHSRAIVEKERFMKRVLMKSGSK